MKNEIAGFIVGREFQVAYPMGGNRNILKMREDGKILKAAINRRGNGYVLIKYVDGVKGHRIANLSTAKMINPIVFSV